MATDIRLRVLLETDKAAGAKAAAMGREVASALQSAASRINARLGGSGALSPQLQAALGGNGALDKVRERMLGTATASRKLFDDWHGGSRRIVGGIGDIDRALLRLATTIYAAKNLGRAFTAVFVTPFKDFLKYIIDATEQYRRFETAISGVTGGMGRAHQLNMALVQGSRRLPLSVGELQDVARQMAFISPLTSRVALGTPQEGAAAAIDFSKLVSRLSMLDPAQGAQGVMVAMREAMAGEFVSLRRRLEISPDLVAGSIGKTQRDLAGNPALTLKALETYASQFIPDEVIDQMGKLFSVRVRKLQDVFRDAAARIGESGVFDKIIDGMERFTDALFKYFDSADWKQRAANISTSLSTILGNLAEGLLQFLQVLTGAETKGDMPKREAELVDALLKKLADVSKAFPLMGEELGAFTQTAMDRIREMFDAIGEYAERLFYRFSGGNILPTGPRESVRLAVATRYATDDMLRQMGLGHLRQQIGTQTTGALRDNPALGDKFAQDVTTGPEALLARAVAPNTAEYQLPVYSYFGKDAKEKEVVEQFIRVIENYALNDLVYNAKVMLQRNGGGELTGRFANPRGVIERLYGRYPQMMRNLLDVYGPQKAAPTASSSNTGDFDPAIQAAIDAVPAKELSGKFFNARYASARAALSRIGEVWNETADEFTKVMNQGLGQMSALSGEDGKGDLFTRVRKMRDDDLAAYDKAINLSTHEMLFNTPANWRKLEDVINGLTSAKGDYAKGFDEQLRKMIGDAQTAAMKFGLGLAQALDKEAPEVQALFYDQIMKGSTTLAESIRQQLEKLPEMAGQRIDALRTMGLFAQPSYMQMRTLQGGIKANMAAIANAGQYGAVLGEGTLNMTPDQIAALANHPMAPMEVKRRQLAYLQSQAGMAGAVMENAKGEYGAALASGDVARINDAKRALLEAQAGVAGLSAQMRELKIQTDVLLQSFIQFGTRVEEALEGSIGDAIYNLMTGTGTLKDALLGFTRDITRAFSQMMAHNFMASMLAPFGGLAAGGQGVAATNVKAAANGAIFEGGFLPIRAFASGGIARRPTIGIIGEGRYNEAVVPLPDGKSIPVNMRGAGEPAVHIYVVNDARAAVQAGFRESKDYLVSAISGDIRRGGQVAKTLKHRA